MHIRTDTDLLVVHCADTKPSMDIGADEIRQWHLERGWSDIGYHWVIRRNGDVEPGRDETLQGAHVRDHNARSIGICLVGGGFGQFDYTHLQLVALDHLLDKLCIKYAPVRILGHCDLDSGKTCPNFDVRSWRAAAQ